MLGVGDDNLNKALWFGGLSLCMFTYLCDGWIMGKDCQCMTVRNLGYLIGNHKAPGKNILNSWLWVKLKKAYCFSPSNSLDNSPLAQHSPC